MLALAVAVTGILATMPYIALQLVGIQAVLDTMGLGGSGNAFVRDLPLIIAFAVLAAYTYSSGLRAPALIAFVKDTLIYIVIVVAIVYVGDEDRLRRRCSTRPRRKMAKTPTGHGRRPGVFIPSDANYWAYGTLAFGSALALFMYPHSMTAVLSARSRNVIRRNAAILPAYSLMLALLALLGYAAIAKKTNGLRPGRRTPNAAARRAALLRPDLPRLVRRRLLRRDRDRRAGAGRDHVDRGGEPVHPQHLPRVPQARRVAEARGAGRRRSSRWW